MERTIGPEEQLEGLSLSLCIRDIIEGRVSIQQVTRIITNTRAPNPRAFELMLAEYAQRDWRRDNPQKATRIARMFYLAGLIEQPRVDNSEHIHPTERGVWRVPDSTEQFFIAEPSVA